MSGKINRKRHDIKLTEELLLSLLKGKKIQFIIRDLDSEEIEFNIRPPFEGTWITHEEINQLQYNAEMGVLNIMERLAKERIIG